jgi:hypothetical protein
VVSKTKINDTYWTNIYVSKVLTWETKAEEEPIKAARTAKDFMVDVLNHSLKKEMAMETTFGRLLFRPRLRLRMT